MNPKASSALAPTASWSQRVWKALCLLLTRVFYRRLEVDGLEHVPVRGPVILTANHVNALADAVVVQAALGRGVHPVARSGLFRNPLLRPILSFIQAVPIYRRRADGTPSAADNEASFVRLFELLGAGHAILIFPEGQSHSDPSLRPIKTGAARLAFGHWRRTGTMPAVVPVGLTFTQKGRFRSSVLVQVGAPVVFEEQDGEADEAAVRRYTGEILHGLESVTLNVDSWQDLALLRHLQHFFALRSKREDRPTLSQRFRSLQRLIDAHKVLRARWPDRVRLLRLQMERFHELCRRHGVRDYQLELRYTPGVVAAFTLRHLAILLFVTPIAVWGLANGFLPYWLTRRASSWSAKGRDQYDSAGMLFGLLFFGFFWGGQTAFVLWRWGAWPWAVLYAASLPFAAALALFLGRKRARIMEDVRVFLLFTRRRELRAYLATKREELEVELAGMARLAKAAKEQPPDLVEPAAARAG